MTGKPFREHAGPIALAVIIGLLAGAGAVLFRWTILLGQSLLWPAAEHFSDQVQAAPWWWVLLVPTLAGLVLGPILTRFGPELKGPGVPEVMESLALHGGHIRHRVTILKSLTTAGFIAAGASVGREGPIVQIGASIGSSLTQLLNLPPKTRRLAVACGSAAGVGAIFQAPMAGTLFAVEILLADMEISALSTIVVAAVTGTLTARYLLGPYHLFTIPEFPAPQLPEYALYALLGLVAGLIGLLLMWLIFHLPSFWKAFRFPAWLTPAAGGLLLGGLGIAFPQCLGIGYEGITATLVGEVSLGMALLLLLVKLLATGLCIGSGMSGGIFAPSLFLGAMLGYALAGLAAMLWPEFGVIPAHYALIGMGAMVSATTLAPITAVLTIFELTYSHQVILPLMLACITGLLTVRILHGFSIYETNLLNRGLEIVKGHEVNVLRGMRIVDHMNRDVQTLSTDTPCPEILVRMADSNFPHFVVLDSELRLAGVLTLRDLRQTLAHPQTCTTEVSAADLMSTEVLTITEDCSMESAFHLFATHEISSLPVVSSIDPGRVLGQLKKTDMLAAYEQILFKQRFLSPFQWICPLPGRSLQNKKKV